MNAIKFKIRLIELNRSQISVASEIGLSESWLSKIVHGWVKPSPEIKARVAGALHCKIDEIF